MAHLAFVDELILVRHPEELVERDLALFARL